MNGKFQEEDRRTFSEKVEQARAEKALDGSLKGDSKEWTSRTAMQYYLTELCDKVQEKHPEIKTHTHKGGIKAAQRWAIIEKSRRMNCIRYGIMALDVQNGKHKLVDARLCGLKTCPVCAKIMANRNERRINAAIEAEQVKKESRDNARYKALGITLTVPNCTGPELRRELQNISKSVQQMLFKGSKMKELWYFAVVGLEVTRNTETGLFHPHAHIVIFVPASYGTRGIYLKKAELVQLWEKYSHRKVASVAQCIKVVENIHQSVKYATKLVKLPFDQDESEDAAAEAEKEESLVWTGKPEFDAETLYWIETACKGLHMTKTYKLDVEIEEEAEEATEEEIKALEDEKQVYLLQRFERMRGELVIIDQSKELLTGAEVKEYQKQLKKERSEKAKAAAAERKQIERAAREISKGYEEAAAAAAAKRDKEALEDIRELVKAGQKGRTTAAKKLRYIQDEKTYQEAMKAISEG